MSITKELLSLITGIPEEYLGNVTHLYMIFDLSGKEETQIIELEYEDKQENSIKNS